MEKNNQEGPIPRMSDIVLGIDLGTTNSSVAVYGPRGMDVINIPEEGYSIPSVVRFPDRGKANIQVGRLAKRYIVLKPDEVFSSFKTFMSSSGWELDSQLKEKYTIAGEELNPTFMAMQVLMKIKEGVQQHPEYGQQGTICRAVICVPAQSQATYVDNVYKAAQAAGFGEWDEETGEKLFDERGRIKGVTILEEPNAAAYAYAATEGFFSGENNKSQKLLIYDFGGGTFDVTLLDVAANRNQMPTFDFINKGGDSKLGGDDLDWSLVNLLAVKLSKTTGFDVLTCEDSIKTKSVLKEWAEEAKKEIAGGATEAQFECSMTIQEQEYSFNEIIRKEDFLGIIQPFIERTIDATKEVLKESNIDIDDINRIVMVGGSCKGYWVSEAIEKHFNKKPFTAPNVDTFVAAGASYYGANIPEIPVAQKSFMYYGIELEGGTFSPMILKGEDFVDGKIVRTRHFTNPNDSGQLSLVGWTISKKIETEQEGDAIYCERSVYEADKYGVRVFNCIGEFNLEIPRKPAGCLDIELTMTLYPDKTILLSGNVNGTPISSEQIKWEY